MFGNTAFVVCFLCASCCSQLTGGSAIASNMTVEEGQDVSLWCPGSVNNENQRVIWWKEESDAKDRIVFDGAVRSVFEPHMSFDGTTGILTIYKANLNDSGVFWCAVGFGEASFKIHLTILDTYKSRSQDVTRATAPGQTVLLPCILPKKDWQYQPDTHSNQEQRSIAHSGVVSSNFSERFQLDAEGLLIKDVKSTDQGTYTCVDHDDQRSRRRIRLFVPCEKKYVREGQSTTLECQAVLHSRVIWWFTSSYHNKDIRTVYLQNRIYNVDRQRFKMQRANNGIFNLLISSVNTSDAGIYRCRENDGRYPGEACTELIVFDAENNRSQEITRAAAPGETVLLPCRLPDMTPDWLYHDHRDQHNVTHNGFVTSKFYGRFQLDSDGLLINDVHIEDQGTYTCVDHHHHHQRQIRLFVPCERKYIHKGQSITLNCQAVLHNSIIWSFIPSHDNNDIRIVYWQNQIYNVDRQRFKILRSEEGIFDLVVNRVNASDAGIYRCRESDGRYPGESCTQLVIEQRSRIQSDITIRFRAQTVSTAKFLFGISHNGKKRCSHCGLPARGAMSSSPSQVKTNSRRRSDVHNSDYRFDGSCCLLVLLRIQKMQDYKATLFFASEKWPDSPCANGARKTDVSGKDYFIERRLRDRDHVAKSVDNIDTLKYAEETGVQNWGKRHIIQPPLRKISA